MNVCDCLRRAVLTLTLALLASTAVAGELKRGSDARADAGEVLIFADGPTRVIVAMDTAGKEDGLVDQWYVLHTSEPVTFALPVHAHAGEVQYRQGALRVSSAEWPAVYSFGIEGYDATWGERANANVIRAEGHGLSRNVRQTTMRITPQKRAATGRVVVAQDDSCPICEPMNDDPGTGATVSPDCDSGGSGASQCSYSLPNGSSCSITCTSSKQYACCRKLADGTTRCSCIYY